MIKPSQAPADRPAQEVGMAASVLKSGRALMKRLVGTVDAIPAIVGGVAEGTHDPFWRCKRGISAKPGRERPSVQAPRRLSVAK